MVAKGTNELKCDPGSVASETADGVRWLLAGLTAYGTPDVLIILLSVIPRCQLADSDLAAFRNPYATLNTLQTTASP